MDIILLILTSIVSAIIASMGIGGGALFIVFSTLFLGMDQKYAQCLNLFLFIFSSASATFINFKNKKIQKKLVKKILPLVFIGAVFGTITFNKIDAHNLKLYFNIFLLIIGIYEIISSLINVKKQKI